MKASPTAAVPPFRRLAEHLRGPHALVFAGGDVPRPHRRVNRRDRHAEVERILRGPASGAFLPGRIEDEVNQWLLRLRVGVAQHRRRDLDQIRLQLGLVPLREHGTDIRRRPALQPTQQFIDFGDELHVAVLDAVMHHLDIMSTAALADIGHAGAIVVGLGRDLGQDWRQMVIGHARPAGHQRRPVERALFTAAHAHADVVQAVRRQLGAAADGVLVERVAPRQPQYRRRSVGDGAARLRHPPAGPPAP